MNRQGAENFLSCQEAMNSELPLEQGAEFKGLANRLPDQVSLGSDTIAAIALNPPSSAAPARYPGIPSRQSETITNQVLDMAVFSLSSVGRRLQHFIREQILVPGTPEIDQDERSPEIFDGVDKLPFARQDHAVFLRPNGRCRSQYISRLHKCLPFDHSKSPGLFEGRVFSRPPIAWQLLMAI
jgi:hypothetical protein